MVTKDDLSTSEELLLPILQVIDSSGGSARTCEIGDAVGEHLNLPEELLALGSAKSGERIFPTRISWALSYSKVVGSVENPRRGFYVLTTLGRDLLAMPEDRADEELRRRLPEAYRAREQSRQASKVQYAGTDGGDEFPSLTGTDGDTSPLIESGESTEWRRALLARLHEMSPTGFERFVLYLLGSFDLELEHTGGTGDEGLDGIGIAPISRVLSARVAVQVKRYNPESSAGIGRSDVALFQRDAKVAGAERAIMVTLGRFTRAARKAARATTPMVDLIDGEKLCDLVNELVAEQDVGVRIVRQVVPEFFDRFESVG